MFRSFFTTEFIINSYKTSVSLNLSEAFIECADKQLINDFTAKTGIKINKNIGLNHSGRHRFTFVSGLISSMTCDIVINNYANYVTVNWKSKTNKYNTPSDAIIDCNDIEFWLTVT